jgi:predicted RNA-binding Zn ribbon-like protein
METRNCAVQFQIVAGQLCLDFINTLDNRPSPEHQKELLPTYRDLTDWAAQAGALGTARHSLLLRESEEHPQAAETVRRKAVEFRECLYRLLSRTLRSRRAEAADLALFNQFLRETSCNFELRARRSDFRLEWRHSEPRLDSVLWPIVKSAADLLTSKDLGKVRECDSADCRWVFVDRSKNHSRRWCDMTVCGNRVKARRFYHRHAEKARTRNFR